MHGPKYGKPRKLTSLQQILGKAYLKRMINGQRNSPIWIRGSAIGYILG